MSVDPLISCAKTRSNRSFAIMRKLLQAGHPRDKTDENGRTALHYACQRGAGAEMLLKSGTRFCFEFNYCGVDCTCSNSNVRCVLALFRC